MEWLTYLLKVSVCSALFFGFYLLVLRKLTFFKFNRFYLLATILLSFIIPALQFNVVRNIKSTYNSVAEAIASNRTGANFQTLPQLGNLQNHEPASFNWSNLVLMAYAIIALGILGFYLFKLSKIFIQSKKYSKTIKGLKIISKQTGFTNCSFFNYVFVNDAELNESELTILLQHEAVHAKAYHSVDKIILMFCKAMLWFNPIIHLYDKALEQTHEYEADEATSKSIGANVYASLLLRLAIAHTAIPMVHNFVKSPIKERIKMLFNQKSKNMKKAIYLLVLPICFSLFWLFGVQYVYAQQKTIQDGVVKGSVDKVQPKTNKVVKTHQGIKTTSVQGKNLKGVTQIIKHTVQIDTVYGEYAVNDDYGCKVTKIECDADHTIITFEYKAMRDQDWVTINKEIYIQANNSMKHYEFVKAENIPIWPTKQYLGKAGDKIEFKIYFEKAPLTAKSIDIIERAGRSNYFNFYEVNLPSSYYGAK